MEKSKLECIDNLVFGLKMSKCKILEEQSNRIKNTLSNIRKHVMMKVEVLLSIF